MEYGSAEDRDISQTVDEELVGTGVIVVGDGVTATFDEETGAVEFYSNGGTLWRNWLEASGIDIKKIKSIKVTSGTVYLPENSGFIFSADFYDETLEDFNSNLEELDLSGFDTSKVTEMDCMFQYCRSLTNLDLSGFDTSNVTDMHNMFGYCESLTNR